jgi:hypothetical protein
MCVELIMTEKAAIVFAIMDKTIDAKKHNAFFGIRHGESEANVAGLIVSAPEVGTQKYGLTERGRRQVQTVRRHINSHD